MSVRPFLSLSGMGKLGACVGRVSIVGVDPHNYTKTNRQTVVKPIGLDCFLGIGWHDVRV